MKHNTNPSSAQADKTGSFSFGRAPQYADKSEYVEKQLIFTIEAIEFEEGQGFDGADRWALTVAPEDGRAREILTFGPMPKRDEQLVAAKTHVDSRGPIVGVTLVRSKNAYFLQSSRP